MTTTYDALVRSGFVGRLKRDVLLEACRDLEYICAIAGHFLEAGDAARRDAIPCTVQLVEDLLSKGLCRVAVFAQDDARHHEIVQVDHDALLSMVERCDSEPFHYFLVTTDRGQAWVDRYLALESEL